MRKVRKAPAFPVPPRERDQALWVSSRLFGNIQGLPLIQGPCLLHARRLHRPSGWKEPAHPCPCEEPFLGMGPQCRMGYLPCSSPRLTQQFCVCLIQIHLNLLQKETDRSGFLRLLRMSVQAYHIRVLSPSPGYI